jgi:hypothetical protein
MSDATRRRYENLRYSRDLHHYCHRESRPLHHRLRANHRLRRHLRRVERKRELALRLGKLRTRELQKVLRNWK